MHGSFSIFNVFDVMESLENLEKLGGTKHRVCLDPRKTGKKGHIGYCSIL